MNKPKYYDGTKLLSLKDLNGNKPELYLVTTNRTGGKTTYFGRLMVRRFKQKGEKFALLYRFNYELDNIADKFFKDIGSLFFPGDEMTSERKANGIYHELFLNGESCGYGITLNSADQIKKNSHLFSDVSSILFDEFQSETNHYCTDECTKFYSVYSSIARGQGKQHRYVPVYMLGNPVTLLNPYYTILKIGARLRDDTKFLRGNGWVLEQGFVQSAADAQKESGIFQAFAGTQYAAYATEGVYLNDNKAFIERPSGKFRYLSTLKYNGKDYAIKEFYREGIIYVDDKPDLDDPHRLTVTTADHAVNYVMLKRNDMFLNNMRWLFERGAFRFKDLQCKEALISALSYTK